jgi:hypothetical protein
LIDIEILEDKVQCSTSDDVCTTHIYTHTNQSSLYIYKQCGDICDTKFYWIGRENVYNNDFINKLIYDTSKCYWQRREMICTSIYIDNYVSGKKNGYVCIHMCFCTRYISSHDAVFMDGFVV